MRRVLEILSILAAAGGTLAAEPAQTKGLLQAFLQGPMEGVEDVVFAVREEGGDWHWYANFGYWSSNPAHKLYGRFGRLCRLNLRSGKATTLLDDPQGAVRDPFVHYDGKTILFSYRKGGSEYYNLYTINTDGTGLKQLTRGPWDDIEPCYLPDGDIMFCSSRCKRWVPCMASQVAILYRCGPEGRNIRCVSSNVEQDNAPWVLSDGRVIYTRWEYVDRDQTSYHHLWTFNPDGTGVMVYFGNTPSPTPFGTSLVIDAKPVPGSDKVVAIFSPGHGASEHAGAVGLIDPSTGPDNPRAVRRVSNHDPAMDGPKGWAKEWSQRWFDPYPFSEDCFLVARAGGTLCVMDGQGNFETIYALPEDLRTLQKGRRPITLQEPRPLVARPREPVIPDRADWTSPTGRFVLCDVTRGRDSAGIKPGEIEKLLVLELLPKPWNVSGLMEPISAHSSYFIHRILGTVPVEADGSADFEIPALRPVFFVALDGKGMAVKRMQSFTSVMPGEVVGCVGCHEARTSTSAAPRSGTLQATRRAPSRLTPVPGVPEIIDYGRDVQPILDRHCVKCHNAEKFAGELDLSGDRTPWFTVGYVSLMWKNYVSHSHNGANGSGNVAPRKLGSSASPLLRTLDGSHHDARLSDAERTLVRTWIDASAPFASTYASLGSGMVQFRPTEIVRRRCLSCHEGGTDVWQTTGDMFGLGRWDYALNLSHPEKALILRAPLAKEMGGLGLCQNRKNKHPAIWEFQRYPEGLPRGDRSAPANVFKDTRDPDYQALLAELRKAAAELDKIKRFDMPGFVPHEHYVRELKRFGILPADLDPKKTPIDVHETDEKYWQSLYYRPEPTAASR